MSLHPGPYWVGDNTLFFRTEPLLESASLPQLEGFARVLNAALPDEERLTDVLRALIRLRRGFTYTSGWRLLAEGEAMRMLPPPRRTRVLPP